MSYILSVIFVLLLFFPAKLMAGQVKIYLDETRTDFIMTGKMDCRVHKSKKGITVGIKGGNYLFSFGPEVTLGEEAKVEWEKAIQGIVVRYQELCSRYNTGVLTKKEYETRLEQIDALAKEASEIQEQRLKNVRSYAKDAFRELDKEADRSDGGDRKRIERLNSNIKSLSLAGR